jgi:hypothetical protein
MVLEVAKLQTKNRHLRDQVKGMRAWQEERKRQYLEVTARLDQQERLIRELMKKNK